MDERAPTANGLPGADQPIISRSQRRQLQRRRAERSLQAQQPGGYTPPAASPQAGDSTDLLHTMRGLCSKSDKLLAQLTTKNFLGLPNQQ